MCSMRYGARVKTAADNQRGTGGAGQMAGQHEHRDPGTGKAREQQQVVDEDRRHVRPQERRGQHALEQASRRR